MEPTLTPPRYSELVEATLGSVNDDGSAMNLRLVLRDPSAPLEILTAVFVGVTALSIDADSSLPRVSLQVVSKRLDGWETPRFWVTSTDQGRIQFGCDAFELAESSLSE